MERMTITKEQLQAALQQWEQDSRDGKTLSLEEARAQPVEECAAQSTAYLWEELKGMVSASPAPMQPTYYVRHPDDSYSVADPQPIS